MTEGEAPSIDFSTLCPVYDRMGDCKQGFKCRFLGGHARKGDSGEIELVKDDEKFAYTRGVVDRRLKKICGEHFVPWEERYGQE